MALPVTEARAIEREITLKSSLKGFDDRIFLLGLSGSGLTLREKGKRESRKMSFEDFVRWMVVHAPETS